MSFNYDRDADDIVTVTMDMPGRKQNVINREFGDAMFEMIERLEAEQDLAGVIVTSAKKDFVAGADIDMLFALEDPEVAFDVLEQLKAGMRRLETLTRESFDDAVATAMETVSPEDIHAWVEHAGYGLCPS